jgi:hypothetical protein
VFIFSKLINDYHKLFASQTSSISEYGNYVARMSLLKRLFPQDSKQAHHFVQEERQRLFKHLQLYPERESLWCFWVYLTELCCTLLPKDELLEMLEGDVATAQQFPACCYSRRVETHLKRMISTSLKFNILKI